MSESLIPRVIESLLPIKDSENDHLPLKIFKTITFLP